MSTALRSTKLTYEDYLLFPDDGKRHESIHGDHYMTPAPETKHQRVSRNLVTVFMSVSVSRSTGYGFLLAS